MSQLDLRFSSVALLYWGLGVAAGKHSVEPLQDFAADREFGVLEFLEFCLAMGQNCAAVCSEGPDSSLGDV